MEILADSTGKILAVGITEGVQGGVSYTGAVPVDFFDTFSLGKYTFSNGVIVDTPNWVAPPAPKGIL